ncbi:MAG: hypothetical protein AAF580_08080 [Pseudomonadota bacterium]
MANESLLSTRIDRRDDSVFASYRWPLITILTYVTMSLVAFTPRLIDFVLAGYWGKSTTNTFEVAPAALNTHALFGMALIPFFFAQPVLGAIIMRRRGTATLQSKHRWLGRALIVSAIFLSVIGFYITYVLAVNSGNLTSVIFIFLVALFVILYFIQAVWEARRGRIPHHVDAVVCAMIFLSLPAAGRLVEALMRGMGIENTRARDIITIGFGYQVELVDITVALIAAIPLLLWVIYAVPRRVVSHHPAKLATVVAFFAVPFAAIVAQSLAR